VSALSDVVVREPAEIPGYSDLAPQPRVNVQVPDEWSRPYSQQSLGAAKVEAPPTEGGPPQLRRPYHRQGMRAIVKEVAPKTPEGKFIDPNTGEVIADKYHFGHRYGYEHRRLLVEAGAKQMTQKEFNDWVNGHPEWFQIEDPLSNMSHQFEKPGK